MIPGINSFNDILGDGLDEGGEEQVKRNLVAFGLKFFGVLAHSGSKMRGQEECPIRHLIDPTLEDSSGDEHPTKPK